ncbi:hypothetical protein M0R04_12680 [Candidatus Dojkabacteria bacterium]|jgi:hypothetical protein|nr:hypothetical protein [Candidatus Dojkabacteria bacterium]
MANGKRQNEHHIWPRSRGGTNDKSNVVIVDAKAHDLFHQLLSNLTPPEIITYLVEKFWGGDWEYVYLAIHEKDIEK